jgi:hypothetical protein
MECKLTLYHIWHLLVDTVHLILTLTQVVVDSQSWPDHELLSSAFLTDSLPEPVQTIVESA